MGAEYTWHSFNRSAAREGTLSPALIVRRHCALRIPQPEIELHKTGQSEGERSRHDKHDYRKDQKDLVPPDA